MKGLWVVPLGCAMMAVLGGCREDQATPEPVEPAESNQTPVEGVTPSPQLKPQAEAGEDETSPHAGGSGKPPGDAANAGGSTGTGKPPADALHRSPEVGGEKLSLTGASMTIPKGWKSQPAPTGMMAPLAVFHLPKSDGDPRDAVVRITHFPAMKGMDDRNIERWLSQVKHPDGREMTRDDARISTTQEGMVSLTIVDISGVVQPRSGAPATETPDQRMIAAIVDHPQGPHFVKITGGVATMKRWEESIDAFLKSAQAN